MPENLIVTGDADPEPHQTTYTSRDRILDLALEMYRVRIQKGYSQYKFQYCIEDVLEGIKKLDAR